MQMKCSYSLRARAREREKTAFVEFNPSDSRKYSVLYACVCLRKKQITHSPCAINYYAPLTTTNPNGTTKRKKDVLIYFVLSTKANLVYSFVFISASFIVSLLFLVEP